jgi:hypothetical protein
MDLAVLPLWVTGWYSLPLRASFALVAGAAFGCALGAAARRWRTFGLGATVLVMVTLLLLAGWPRVGEARHLPAKRGVWQTELFVTAQWAKSYADFTGSIAGGGRLGAYDAGLLGFELHDRGVVNLDGLVNDFAYADLLMSPSSRDDVLERYRRTGVYYLIGRLAPTDPRRPRCATVIWEDPVPVAYRGSIEGVTTVPVVVLELGASCGLNPEVIR